MLKYSVFVSFLIFIIQAWEVELIIKECNKDKLDENALTSMTKFIIPELESKTKGDAGKIAVIGGSSRYTGAPYFAAISALKVGADLVSVITTDDAAPVIKSYSPDLIVVPYKQIDLTLVLKSMHVIVIGPGLGREPENLKLAYDVIEICKVLRKPVVIDADGLYAIYKNVTILKDYPQPGAVLTPNHLETQRLIQAVPSSNDSWYNYWGDSVTVLTKGEKDQYYSRRNFDWSLEGGGSGRRAGGQGDILAGALGTFYHWAIQSKLCEKNYSDLLAQSVATFAAAKFTRACNAKAFRVHGRSMTASDMLKEIHSSFDDNFL